MDRSKTYRDTVLSSSGRPINKQTDRQVKLMANDYYSAKFRGKWFDMTTGSPSFRHVYDQDIHAYVCKLLFTIGREGGYYNVLFVVKEKTNHP